MPTDYIPFNTPYTTDKQIVYLAEAQRNFSFQVTAPSRSAVSNGSNSPGCAKALLTHSCTSALDLSAMLLDIQSGDEVILQSPTFVSTANAFVPRGAIPVFVDVREVTLNLDENLIEDAITQPRGRSYRCNVPQAELSRP